MNQICRPKCLNYIDYKMQLRTKNTTENYINIFIKKHLTEFQFIRYLHLLKMIIIKSLIMKEFAALLVRLLGMIMFLLLAILLSKNYNRALGTSGGACVSCSPYP